MFIFAALFTALAKIKPLSNLSTSFRIFRFKSLLLGKQTSSYYQLSSESEEFLKSGLSVSFYSPRFTELPKIRVFRGLGEGVRVLSLKCLPYGERILYCY